MIVRAREKGVSLREHMLATFFIITLGIGFTASIGIWLMPAQSPIALLSGIAIAFSSTIAALVVFAISGDRPGFRLWLQSVLRIRVQFSHYLIAFLVPSALWAGATVPFVISNRVGEPVWANLATAPIILFMVLAEEAGWRGFALTRLQRTVTPLRASLIIGVLHGSYHVSAYLQTPSYALLTFFVSVAGSVFMTWLFNRSGGSVPVTTISHTFLNIGAALLLPAVDADAMVPMFTLFTLLLVTAATLIAVSGKLRQPASYTPIATVTPT